MPDFIEALEEQVAGYSGTWRDVVALAPAFAALMLHLLNDPRMTREHRLLADAALAYLVSPNDVIPEDQVGPYGYLDDIFCCAYVATRIAEELSWEALEEGWSGEGTARAASEDLLGREQELLGMAGDDVLRFAGLVDRLEPLDRSGASRAASTEPRG